MKSTTKHTLDIHVYVYTRQVLTECKQQCQFGQMLSRLENKPACQGRSLEIYLTYPMHQVGLKRYFYFFTLT